MKIRQSTKIFLYGLAFCVGVFIGNYWQPSVVIIATTILVFIIMSMLVKKSRLISLLIIFIILGLFRFGLSIPIVDESNISFYNEQTLTLEGVIKEPDVRVDHAKLTLDSKLITLKDKSTVPVAGKVLIKTKLFPEFEYGDSLSMKCKLRTPEPIEDFRYDIYLARYNIYTTCYATSIYLKDKNNGNPIISYLLQFKKYFSFKLNQSIAEPQASFLAGILIGSRKGIPADIMEQFNRTGITHVIAISGYNISIIAVMLLNTCLSIGINRKKAFTLIVIGIIFFVIFTGASAAVTRAGIMGIIVLFSKHLGRKSQVKTILVLTAVFMLIGNPKILRDDVGFQLSFAATIGLIYLMPLLEPFFKWLPKKFAIQENIVSTVAATIITAPMIMYYFERISVVAIAVNSLILWIIPPIMLVGFIQVLAAIAWLPLGQGIGWITWWLLQYIMEVVKLFSAISWAVISVQFNLLSMIISYILLLVLLFIAQKKLYEVHLPDNQS